MAFYGGSVGEGYAEALPGIQARKNEEAQRQMMLYDLAQKKQQDDMLMRARTALGNAIPGMFGGQAPVGQQALNTPPPPSARQTAAPAPGQASVPTPRPPMMGAGGPQPYNPALASSTPPMMGMTQATGPGQIQMLKGFAGGPSAPQQLLRSPQPAFPLPARPPAGALGATGATGQGDADYTQQKPTSFEQIATSLMNQGVKGPELVAALEQFKPFMDYQGKLNHQQFLEDLAIDKLLQHGVEYDETQKNLDARQAERLKAQEKLLGKRLQGANPVVDADTVKSWADTYIRTGVMPSLGMGMQTLKAQLLKEIARQEKKQGITGSDVAGNKGDIIGQTRNLANLEKVKGVVGSFESMAKRQTEILREAAKKVDFGKYPMLNDLELAASKGYISDPEVNRYIQAVHTLQGEMAKITSGNTGASPGSIAALKAAAESLRINQSPEALNAVLDQINQEFDNRMKGIDEQIQSARAGIRNAGSPAKPAAPAYKPTAAEQKKLAEYGVK